MQDLEEYFVNFLENQGLLRQGHSFVMDSFVT